MTGAEDGGVCGCDNTVASEGSCCSEIELCSMVAKVGTGGSTWGARVCKPVFLDTLGALAKEVVVVVLVEGWALCMESERSCMVLRHVLITWLTGSWCLYWPRFLNSHV